MSDELTKYLESHRTTLAKAMQENPEKVGATLVHTAIRRYDKEFSETVLAFVQMLVKHREALQYTITKAQRETDLTDKRLEAIEHGEFSVEGYTGRIIFKDSALQFG